MHRKSPSTSTQVKGRCVMEVFFISVWCLQGTTQNYISQIQRENQTRNKELKPLQTFIVYEKKNINHRQNIYSIILVNLE